MEYRIDVKVRNNVILKKIESSGYKSIGEFCRLNNLMNLVGRLGEIVNMKSSPLKSDGSWQTIILKCSEILGYAPEDFFTESQLNTIIKNNKRSYLVEEAEMKFMIDNHSESNLLEDIISKDEMKNTVMDKVNTLSPRESKVLRLRFGLDGEDFHTFEEAGKVMDVSRERIRQIEAKALRKLRHESRSDDLRDFI